MQRTDMDKAHKKAIEPKLGRVHTSDDNHLYAGAHLYILIYLIQAPSKAPKSTAYTNMSLMRY